MPDMNQGKWGPGMNVNEQEMVSHHNPVDVRRSRNRAMSASSSGSRSPQQMPYYEPGWNAAMGGMAPNLGMVSGGGSMGNSGAAFTRMM